MLRKPTTWIRVPLTTVPVMILPAEQGAAPGTLRCVQILLPDSPDVEIVLDHDPKADAARDAVWPQPPTGKVIKFDLMPHQTISGRALDEYALVSVIVEYR